MKAPETIFRDRNYSQQSLVSLITANYIVFAIAVQASVNCERVHWFLWVALAGLVWYNYYIIRRNSEEFAERKTQIIYAVSVIGMALLYYLLGVVGLHCNPGKPV